MTALTMYFSGPYFALLIFLLIHNHKFGTADRHEELQNIRRRSTVFIVTKIFQEQSIQELDLHIVIENLYAKHKYLLLTNTRRNIGITVLSLLVFVLQALIIINDYHPVIVEKLLKYLYIDMSWLFSLFFVTYVFAIIWLYYYGKYFAVMGRYSDLANNAGNKRLVVVEYDGDSGST